jgi:septal ring factor EnvC (AmiA/AmiB activator)
MIYRIIIAAVVLFSAAAFAQQPPTPAQVAIQLDNIINQWAQVLETQQQTIKADQDKIADLQKQLDALKSEQKK